MRFLRWLGRMIREYAIVIAAMLAAGMVLGGCAVLEYKPREMEPMIRVRDCRDSQPIRLMPNWIRQWDPPYIKRQA